MNFKSKTNFIPYEQNMNVMKTFFKKPIVLVVAIIQALFGSCFTLSFALNHFFMTAFKFNITFMLELTSVALYIFMVIGYIVVYLKSKDPRPASSPVIGFRILHITTVMKFLLISAAVGISMNNYKDFDNLLHSYITRTQIGETIIKLISVVSFILIALVVLILAFVILFYLMQIRFFSKLKKNMVSLTLTYKGAMIFAVTNIIYALIIPLIGFNEYIGVMNNSSNSIRALLPIGSVFFATSLFITNAIMALSYRKYIKRTAYQITTSVYEQPEALPVIGATNVMSQQNITPPASPYKTYAELNNIMTSTCPFCKNEVSSNNIFCHQCGRRIK